VFLLVSIGLYNFFGWSAEVVYGVFVEGAVVSYVEDALVVAIAFLVGVPLVIALRKPPAFRPAP